MYECMQSPDGVVPRDLRFIPADGVAEGGEPPVGDCVRGFFTPFAPKFVVPEVATNVPGPTLALFSTYPTEAVAALLPFETPVLRTPFAPVGVELLKTLWF